MTSPTRPWLAAYCALALGLCPIAALGDDPLEQARQFRRAGDGERLIELLQTHGEQFDAQQRLLLRAQAHELLFRDRDRDPTQRHEALDEAMAAYRELIEAHELETEAVIWRIDLAQLLLFNYLGAVHNEAALFVDFGVPSDEQREAFGRAAVEAMEQLSDAELDLFDLRGYLPRQADFHEKYVATGLWRRIDEQYGQARLPVLLSFAAYYLALLPDDHDYYQNLGAGRIPRQRTEAPAERQRLLDLARARLRPFIEDEQDRAGVRAFALPLYGRVLLRRGDHQQAEQVLSPLLDGERSDINNLVANLVAATALDRRDRISLRDQVIERLRRHPLVQASALYRLLVVDVEHQLRLHRALAEDDRADRRAALRRAYQPYEDMLDDDELPSAQREGLRQFIFNRWAGTLEQQEHLEDMPPMVLLAVGELTLRNGRLKMLEAGRARGDESERLRSEGRELIEQAAEVLDRVIAGADVPPASKAQAYFRRGLAAYELAGRTGRDAAMAAAEFWIELGRNRDLHGQDVAVEGLGNAVGLLRAVYQRSLADPPADVTRRYVEAAELLLEHFPDSDAAHNERTFFAYHVLQGGDEYRRAAEEYARVPEDHRDFWIAQIQRLYCTQQLKRRADAGRDRDRIRRQLDEVAESIMLTARRHREEAEADEEQVPDAVRIAEAESMLLLTRVRMDLERWAEALEAIEPWEQVVGDESDLRLRAMRRLVDLYVNTDRLDDAVAIGERMMQEFTGEAGRQAYGALQGLLDELAMQMDEAARRVDIFGPEPDLRREYEMRRDAYARATASFAELMLPWAQEQDMGPAELRELRLAQGRALRHRGELDEALEVFLAMYEDNPRNLDAMHEVAETRFDLEQFTEAAEIYRELRDGGRTAADEEGGILPWYYWKAQLRLMQIETHRRELDRDQMLRRLDRLEMEGREQVLLEEMKQVDQQLAREGLTDSRREELTQRREQLTRTLGSTAALARITLDGESMGGFHGDFRAVRRIVLQWAR